jgi:glycosyltransferase involved in cell wall biosynthesis
MENKFRLDFRQAIWVANQVRKNGYDTVLSMSERLAIPLTPLLPKSVQHVVIGHHLISPYKFSFAKWAGLYQKWNVIVAPTQAEACVIKEKLTPGLKRLECIPFPIDTQFFKPGDQPTLTANAEHILSVGLSYRDYPTLISALKKLPHVAGQFRVGSSWVSGKSGIKKASLPENVSLKPFIPLLELLHCYEECRFVVIPISKTTQWSAGSISVLIAEAMGKPVIVSRTPGMPDYVLDRETGFLVEMGDPDAMAEAIDYLWNNPDVTDRMGKRAREWVAETFSLDGWVERIANILSSLGTS